MFVSCFYFFYAYFVYLHFFLFLCIYIFYFILFFYFLFKKDSIFFNMFYNENNFLKKLYFCWLDASPSVFPKDFFNKNGTLRGPPQRLPWSLCPALPCPCPALPCLSPAPQGTGIFQALPTQTDTTVALIYKIDLRF